MRLKQKEKVQFWSFNAPWSADHFKLLLSFCLWGYWTFSNHYFSDLFSLWHKKYQTNNFSPCWSPQKLSVTCISWWRCSETHLTYEDASCKCVLPLWQEVTQQRDDYSNSHVSGMGWWSSLHFISIVSMAFLPCVAESIHQFIHSLHLFPSFIRPWHPVHRLSHCSFIYICLLHWCITQRTDRNRPWI